MKNMRQVVEYHKDLFLGLKKPGHSPNTEFITFWTENIHKRGGVWKDWNIAGDMVVLANLVLQELQEDEFAAIDMGG